MDTIRVLRVVEYIGPKDKVEVELRKAVHGQRVVNGVTIKAATVEPFITEPHLKTKPPGFSSDPVHHLSIDNTWWFWNETWSDKVGPFFTEEDARTRLAAYCKHLNETIGASNPKAVETTDQSESYFKY